VIVVDNDGFTVERAIHGAAEPYNDIARWDWTKAPAFFGADESAVAEKVGTVAELADILADAQQHPDRLTVVQAVVPAMDVPPLLATMARSLGATPATR
jgi:indolepyruvate decarboxylase